MESVEIPSMYKAPPPDYNRQSQRYRRIISLISILLILGIILWLCVHIAIFIDLSQLRNF